MAHLGGIKSSKWRTMMKRFRKILCYLTALAMLMTMSSIGVFAAENVDTDQIPVGENEIQDAQQVQEGEEYIDGDAEGSADEAEVYVENEKQNVVTNRAGNMQIQSQSPAAGAASTPAVKQSQPVQQNEAQGLQSTTLSGGKTDTLSATKTTKRLPTPTVKALSGYNSIKITWKKVPGADAYNVGIWNPKKKRYSSVGVTKKLSIEKRGLKTRTNYYFRVMAVKIKPESKGKSKYTYKDIQGKIVNGVWSAPSSKPAKTGKKQTVNRLRIYFNLKKSRNYGGVWMKAGTRTYAEGYGGGKYKFRNPKGKMATVGRVSVKNRYASYIPQGGRNYTKAEAEYFINSYMKKNKKAATSKKRMIWVSSYTQHLYIFEKKNGKWKATKWNWEVSMGCKDTPSPTGNKKIIKIIGSRHGISHWNVTSGNSQGYNALHGVKSNWGKKLGNLASHGCIRSKTSNAKIIRYKCGKGTRVVVF